MQAIRQRAVRILQKTNQLLRFTSYNFSSLLRLEAITYNYPLRLTSIRLQHTMSAGSNFKLEETEGDLFSAPKAYSLAHCVGADLAMGAGIAVKFKQTYGRVDELSLQNVKSGGVGILKDHDRYIYYLVTKPRSYDKPTYDSLSSSLKAMREHMVANDVKKLAIPRIGCGIDGLQWDEVTKVLHRVFGSDNIEIMVYNFVPK